MSQKWSDRCLEPGRSVLLGSVDSKGLPSCCRGIAIQSRDDFKTAVIYVPVSTSRDTISNIASTRRLAVATTHPIDHHSVQFKGTTMAVRLATDDEKEYVESRLLDFADVLADIGLPRKITRSINHWPAFAIEMRVDQVFDQTPGPKAGNPMP